jgi:hypothetical protein
MSDELRDEYQFDYRAAKPNRFAATLKKGGRLVVLDPEVAAAFQKSETVNAVLRLGRDGELSVGQFLGEFVLEVESGVVQREREHGGDAPLASNYSPLAEMSIPLQYDILFAPFFTTRETFQSRLRLTSLS